MLRTLTGDDPPDATNSSNLLTEILEQATDQVEEAWAGDSSV